MKKNLFIAAMSLLVLAGCSSNEDEIDNIIANNDNAITFDTYVGKVTKALEKGPFTTGDSWAVLGHYQESDPYTTFSNNFMSKEIMNTTNGSDWTYTNTKYWPTTGKINFVAFHPSSITPSILNGIALPFVVKSAPTTQEDMMWSTIKEATINNKGGSFLNGTNNTSPDATVFKFKHALSKVSFNAKFADETSGITVKLTDISIADIKNNGTYTIPNDLTTGIWGELSGNETYEVLKEGNNSIETTAGGIIGESLLMIPQSVSEKEITVSYKLAYTGSSVEVPYTSTVKFPKDAIWAQNTTYTYTLNISLNELAPIEMSTTVDSWGTDVNGDAK